MSNVEAELVAMNEQLTREIDKRARVEQSLRESQRVLETLMGNLPGMAYRCLNDPAWTMQFVSEGCLPLTGYQSEELLQNRIIGFGDLIHPDDCPMVWETVQTAVQNDRPFTIIYRIRTREGEEKWVWEQGLQVIVPEYQQPILEGFITDITQQVQAEKKSQESLAKWESLVQNAPYFIAIMDRDGHLHFVNRLYPGFKMDEVIGSSNYDYIDPKYHNLVKQKVRQVFETGECATYELEAAGENAAKIWYETRVSPLILGDEVAYVTMISLDISARKRAEEKLRQSESRLSVVFNNTTDLQLLWAVEPDGVFRILAVNDPYIETARRFGLDISRDDILGKTLPEIVSLLGFEQGTLDYTFVKYEQALRTGEVVKYTESIALSLGEYHSEITLVPITEQDGECQYLLFNSHNITELRQTAEALKELNAELDERVRERTADLNKLVQLMAGREVRMVELKKVIKQLRAQLSELGIDPGTNDPFAL